MKNERESQLLLTQNKKKGLNVKMSVFLLTGELIGSGIVTLPYSIMTTGPIGFILLISIIGMCCYGGVTLSRCWQIVIERYPIYDTHVRDPFPVMGEVCYGRPMRILVRVLVYIMQFGCAVVVLLLASEMANALQFENNLSYCLWILILGLILLPLMLLGSPKDFWQIGFVALLTTIIAAILITVLVAFDYKHGETNHPRVTFQAVMLAFSTICFANSGIPIFPNIQNDMMDKSKFTSAVLYANLIMLVLFLPIPTLIYMGYPGEVHTNILLSFSPGYISTAAKICMVIHTMLSFLIIINPVSQDLEEQIGIKKEFGKGRIVSRTLIMVAAIFVGETIPKFSHLLDVIGGFTLPLLSMLLPSIFYLKLTSKKFQEDMPTTKWSCKWYQRLILYFLIAFSLVSAVIATSVSIDQMVSHNTFVPPCYV